MVERRPQFGHSIDPIGGIEMSRLLGAFLLGGMLIIGWRPVPANALSPETMERVKISVIELCRGGTVEGGTQSIDITGEAGATVLVLKRLADLGVSGRVEFSQSEWEGIQAAIPEHWDQSAYNECVTPNLRLFLDKLDQSEKDHSGDVKIYNQAASTLCGDSVFRVVVYKQSARLAKPEALLFGSNLVEPQLKLRVGESTLSDTNCAITLAGTGFDRDFYAHLKYEKLAE